METKMKRLFRSAEDRKIAGVCVGLGEYFELDPVLFRVAFLVLLCFGGTGLLAYLAFWILVPLQDELGQALPPGRLRRSAADRKVAGVCGGLGEFFDIDPVLFRIAFIVAAFAGGVGILLYIMFWLAMPAASPAGAGDSGSSDARVSAP